MDVANHTASSAAFAALLTFLMVVVLLLRLVVPLASPLAPAARFLARVFLFRLVLRGAGLFERRTIATTEQHSTTVRRVL